MLAAIRSVDLGWTSEQTSERGPGEQPGQGDTEDQPGEGSLQYSSEATTSLTEQTHPSGRLGKKGVLRSLRGER